MGKTAAQTAHASARGRCSMRLLYKGLILAGLQALMVLSLTGKLLYDRATCPRVWVRTAPWDPSLPIRGRYLSLQLMPERGVSYFSETYNQRVLFFVPEHALPFEESRFKPNAPEVW